MKSHRNIKTTGTAGSFRVVDVCSACWYSLHFNQYDRKGFTDD